METIPATMFRSAFARMQMLYQHWLTMGPCLWCQQRKQSPQLLCSDCQKAVPVFNQQADGANLLEYPAIANHIACKYLDTLLVLSPYQHPLDQWISALKFQRRPDYGRLLSYLLAAHLQRLFQQGVNSAELLVPVPLHWRRLKSRQYNQATLIARQVSKICNIPLSNDLLRRKTSTATQVGLGGKKRRGNLRDAFDIKDKHWLPQHVAIVDDVLTTGSTVNEIARVLKRQGVSRVSVYCVAISLND
ncbi:ComF family protein [Thalassotalea litorea]|uniref:ComF family protein n=1 Tax=Thalassotalea litorea TaxID=2020715 RepID=A0A5R9IPW2_9GAMM|nr:ComF family protein [Thalassotalea litorea]TLU65311.1 ComF family protein [Thalassotalea litorea]